MCRCLKSVVLASALALVTVLPVHAAAASHVEDRASTPVPGTTSDPESCTWWDTAFWDTSQSPRTITFSGNVSCTIPMVMTGQAHLFFFSTGSLEKDAPVFGPGLAGGGISTSSFFPAVPGTEHLVVSVSSVEAPPGQVWAVLPGPPDSCTGVGTPIATCTVPFNFTVT